MKHPDRVRRCFTCSKLGLLFLRDLADFEIPILLSEMKNVGRGAGSNLVPFILGTEPGPEVGLADEIKLCGICDDVEELGILGI